MKRKFIINKSFSINSDEDFRDYAHNLMKNAHDDDYSEEETNKVVDDLIKDNPAADYGELIGRLTSGFGQKNFDYTPEAKVKYYERMKKLYNEQDRELDPSNPVDKAKLYMHECVLKEAEIEAKKETYEQKAKADLEKNLNKFDQQIEAARTTRLKAQDDYEKIKNSNR